MTVKEKMMNNDWAALYLGIYGILIQVISFSIVYLMSDYIQASSVDSTAKALIYAWYLFSILALLPITVAILQIRQRKATGKTFKIPILGLLINLVWFVAMMVFFAAGFCIQ